MLGPSKIFSISMSRHELLEWVNNMLKSHFNTIEELCTGAAYCQLMDMLFHGSVPLHKVKFMTNAECDFRKNFFLLQAAFEDHKVDREIPIDTLVRGRRGDNLEFLQWFKKFFDSNFKKDDNYDAYEVRGGAQMGFLLMDPRARSPSKKTTTLTKTAKPRKRSVSLNSRNTFPKGHALATTSNKVRSKSSGRKSDTTGDASGGDAANQIPPRPTVRDAQTSPYKPTSLRATGAGHFAKAPLANATPQTPVRLTARAVQTSPPPTDERAPAHKAAPVGRQPMPCEAQTTQLTLPRSAKTGKSGLKGPFSHDSHAKHDKEKVEFGPHKMSAKLVDSTNQATKETQTMAFVGHENDVDFDVDKRIEEVRSELADETEGYDQRLKTSEFLYQQLRDVEVICDEFEEEELDDRPFLKKTTDILYDCPDGFGPKDEDMY